MDCDRVFMALTRGPFPSGDPQDGAVEAHLSACPACHRIAEALRPAIGLFVEAVTPAEGRGLPGYRGAVGQSRPGSRVMTAQLSAVRQATTQAVSPPESWAIPPHPHRPGSTGLSAVRITAVLAVCLVAAVALEGWLGSGATLRGLAGLFAGAKD